MINKLNQLKSSLKAAIAEDAHANECGTAKWDDALEFAYQAIPLTSSLIRCAEFLADALPGIEAYAISLDNETYRSMWLNQIAKYKADLAELGVAEITNGSMGKHDWAIGKACGDGIPVFVDDRQLSYRESPEAARAYALEIIERLQADGDYRLNDKPAGFLPPPLPASTEKLDHHAISIGTVLVTLIDLEDSDEDGAVRVSPAGSLAEITSMDWYPKQGTTFGFCIHATGGTGYVTADELDETFAHPAKDIDQSQQQLTPISRSAGVKSISDDDLCSDCLHCLYRPGEMSNCKLEWPGMEDSSGYVQECSQFVQIERTGLDDVSAS